MSRHSPEYINWINSREWRSKSKGCQGLTCKHCILFPWLKSRHSHHLTYRNMTKEIPIRDIVALSKTAHGIVHWRIFWKSGLRTYVNHFLRVCMMFSIVFWNFLRLFGVK